MQEIVVEFKESQNLQPTGWSHKIADNIVVVWLLWLISFEESDYIDKVELELPFQL